MGATRNPNPHSTLNLTQSRFLPRNRHRSRTAVSPILAIADLGSVTSRWLGKVSLRCLEIEPIADPGADLFFFFRSWSRCRSSWSRCTRDPSCSSTASAPRASSRARSRRAWCARASRGRPRGNRGATTGAARRVARRAAPRPTSPAGTAPWRPRASRGAPAPTTWTRRARPAGRLSQTAARSGGPVSAIWWALRCRRQRVRSPCGTHLGARPRGSSWSGRPWPATMARSRAPRPRSLFWPRRSTRAWSEVLVERTASELWWVGLLRLEEFSSSKSTFSKLFNDKYISEVKSELVV